MIVISVQDVDVGGLNVIRVLARKPMYARQLQRSAKLSGFDVVRKLISKGYIDSFTINIGSAKRRYYFLTEDGYSLAQIHGFASVSYEVYRRKVFRNHGFFTILAKTTYGDRVVSNGYGKRRPDLVHKIGEKTIHVEYERTNKISTLLDHIYQSLKSGAHVLILSDKPDELHGRLLRAIEESEGLFKDVSGYVALMHVDDYIRGKIRRWSDYQKFVIHVFKATRHITPVDMLVKKEKGMKQKAKVYLKVIDKDNGKTIILTYTVVLNFFRKNMPTIPTSADYITGYIKFESKGEKEFLDFTDPKPIYFYPNIAHLIFYILESNDTRLGIIYAITKIAEKLFPNHLKYTIFNKFTNKKIEILKIKTPEKTFKLCKKCASISCKHTKMIDGNII